MMQSFSNPEAPTRVVCATVAFGMDINCPDIKGVIQLGAPDDIESYIQVTGWVKEIVNLLWLLLCLLILLPAKLIKV